MKPRTETTDIDQLVNALQKKLATENISTKDYLAITDRLIKLIALRQRAGKKPKGSGYNPFATPEPEESPNGGSVHALI